MADDIKPAGYRPRIVDTEIRRFLEVFGAVEVAGTKWCGKTWTSRAHAASISYVDRGNNLALAKADPSLMLIGDAPHVIDEWQRVPALWDVVRHAVDDAAGKKGLWILTGSSTPRKKEERPAHSGAGRIGRIRMLPMSLSESGESNAAVSLAGLFRGEFSRQKVEADTRELLDVACRGGWPEAINAPTARAQTMAREYLRAILDESIPALGKSSDMAERLIASLARNLCQAATYQTLRLDMYGGEEDPEGLANDKTIVDYLETLRSLYFIEGVKGWVPPARSPKRVQLKEKRYFADPSLAVAALGMTPESLLEDWQTFGLIFENLCMRDVLVYARALPNVGMTPVRYYRDDSGLEADAIIELADGRWAALEFKVSEDKVPDGIENLERLRAKLLKNPHARTREPEFLAVIVGLGEYARKSKEGVYVIPLRTLGA